MDSDIFGDQFSSNRKKKECRDSLQYQELLQINWAFMLFMYDLCVILD